MGVAGSSCPRALGTAGFELAWHEVGAYSRQASILRIRRSPWPRSRTGS